MVKFKEQNRKIRPAVVQLIEEADEIAKNGKAISLNELFGTEDWSMYEIAYRIYEEDGKIVVLIMAGTRENFYDEQKRYLNRNGSVK